MKRLQKTKKQLKAVEVLKLLKGTSTYEELEEKTGLSTVDLSRYVNGRVLPGIDRAEKIIESFDRSSLEDEIDRRISFEEGYVDHSRVIYSTRILREIAATVGEIFEGSPDKILTAASDGIPLGTHIADFYDVDCVYAKKKKESGVREFIEASTRTGSGATLLYYLPRWSLEKNEKILMVDDIIRTGHTCDVLYQLIEKAGSNLFGVFSLFTFENMDEKLREKFDCNVESLMSFE